MDWFWAQSRTWLQIVMVMNVLCPLHSDPITVLQQVLIFGRASCAFWDMYTHCDVWVCTQSHSHIPSLTLWMPFHRDVLSVSKVYSISLRLNGELLLMAATCDLDHDKCFEVTWIEAGVEKLRRERTRHGNQWTAFNCGPVLAPETRFLVQWMVLLKSRTAAALPNHYFVKPPCN